jgi:uncharacterized linocin/CFP29 family protein
MRERIIDDGRSFWTGSQGKWAGEQLLKALGRARKGDDITKVFGPASLRTNDTLRRYEWVQFDSVLIAEAQIRLRAVADLIALGLVKNIPNGMAKTVLEYEKITDIDAATTSLDGITRSENDRIEFSPAQLPLPITHKDWYLNIRALLASRITGEPLDTTHARLAGRKCAEEAENMLFNGGKTFMGNPIYGYLTHPSRNTMGYGTNGTWNQSAKTGSDIIVDIESAISILEGDRQYGPYDIYLPPNASVKMSDDFKANSDRTIRERILAMDQVRDIKVADQLPNGNIVVVALNSDNVEIVQGEPLQTIQWDVEGGFRVNFKAFQILVPLIKADAKGRSGIVHIS